MDLKFFKLFSIQKLDLIYINIMQFNTMEFSFILLGGGESNRFNSSLPKQYHKIAGKTLIDISIIKIREFKEIKSIIFVDKKEIN